MKNISKTALAILASLVIMESCKKEPANNSGGGPGPTPPPGTGVGTGPGGSIVAGTDPSVVSTQGFFLDNWAGKTFTKPSAQSISKPAATGAVSVTVDLSQITTKTSGNIFGNNTNSYMGQYVTDAVLIGNLTALAPRILHAPGRNPSDIY